MTSMRTFIFKPKDIFPIYPFTMNCDWPQEDIFKPKGRAFHQIFIVTDGNGILTLRDERYSVSAGDMFFIGKFCPHTYEGDEAFKTTFLGFDGALCEHLLEYYGIRDFRVGKGKSRGATKALIEDFYAETAELRDYGIISSKTFSAVTSFFSEILKVSRKPIEKVRDYVEANYASPLTLADILEFYPYSKPKLCREFLSTYGMTIFEYLTKTRLGYAKAMLSNNPEYKLKQIATACGFNDVSYFCRVYKSCYGKSPRSSN